MENLLENVVEIETPNGQIIYGMRVYKDENGESIVDGETVKQLDDIYNEVSADMASQIWWLNVDEDAEWKAEELFEAYARRHAVESGCPCYPVRRMRFCSEGVNKFIIDCRRV